MFLMWLVYVLCFFFFFQAEDGIRDVAVTGVRTCALPICDIPSTMQAGDSADQRWDGKPGQSALGYCRLNNTRMGERFARCRTTLSRWARARSEERRVGKEGRARWWRSQYNRREEDTCGGR